LWLFEKQKKLTVLLGRNGTGNNRTIKVFFSVLIPDSKDILIVKIYSMQVA
jgi:ABC-type Na+ transport system ATPase subunit NatA